MRLKETKLPHGSWFNEDERDREMNREKKRREIIERERERNREIERKE